MFQKLTNLALVLMVLFALGGTSFAQAPTPAIGDYGSVASGNWSALSTWRQWDGTGWNTTPTGLPGSSRQVFILTGTTVTYDVGSQNCKSLIVESGATFKSDSTLPCPSSSLMPIKITGPTVWVDGTLGGGPNDALVLETKYNGTVTLLGTGRVNLAQVRPNSSQSGTMTFVFACNANINYAGSDGSGGAGIYTQRGTQTSSTIVINAGDTVNFASNSSFMVNPTAGLNGLMNTTLNVNGVMNLTSGNLVLADSAAFKDSVNIGSSGVINEGGTITPYIKGGNIAMINVAAGGALNILNGGTADFTNPAATVSGAGAFTLNPGGTLVIGANVGLNTAGGPIQTTGLNTFSKMANYKYVGAGGQSTGPLLPDSVYNLTIGAGAIDTLTSPITVTDTLLVNGTLVVMDSIGIDTAYAMVVNGTYQHGSNILRIPAATWNTGSTCLVTGLTTGDANGLVRGANQKFYNFTVNCPNLTQPGIPVHFDMQNDTIMGNVTIHDTHGSFLALTGFDTPGPKTITINGNFTVDSSSCNVAVDDYSSKHPVEKVTTVVKGNLVVAGNLALTIGSAHNLINMVVLGNVSLRNGGALYSHSSTTDSLIFAGTSLQTFEGGTSANNYNLMTHILSGAIVDMDTSVFSGGSSTFTLDSGATVRTGHPLGLNGNIAVGAGTSLSEGANYVYDGSVPQVTGSLLPRTIANLTINNPEGVSLSDTVSVINATIMSSGILRLGVNTITTDSISGASQSSYVSTDSLAGYLHIAKVDSAFFPVGTSVEGYAPVWIKNSGASTGFNVSASPDTSRTTNGLGRVDVKWKIIPTAATGVNCRLTFGWMTGAEDTVFAKNRSTYALIYLLSDTGAVEAGSGNYATQLSSQPYTTSRGGITTFGTFAVGRFTTTGVNELQSVPIEFKLYQNYPNPFNPTTKIEFTVAKKGMATLTVYNILGQRVTTLFSGNAQPGTKYSVDFNGGSFASGVYFSVLQSEGQRQIQKMVLMK